MLLSDAIQNAIKARYPAPHVKGIKLKG